MREGRHGGWRERRRREDREGSEEVRMMEVKECGKMMRSELFPGEEGIG